MKERKCHIERVKILWMSLSTWGQPCKLMVGTKESEEESAGEVEWMETSVSEGELQE